MSKAAEHENRRLIFFSELGIPHLFSLGKVELLANTQVCLPLHIHPDQFEICFHYDGRQEYVVEDVPYTTQSGDLFITYPNEKHSSGNSAEEKSKLFYFIFELTPQTQNFMGLPAELSDYIRDTLLHSPCRHLRGDGAIRQTLQQIFDLYDQPHPFRIERIRTAVVEFFYLVTESIRRLPSRPDLDGDILTVIRALEQDPAGNWNVSRMADLAGLSVSYFKRKFKLQTGLSPYDYLLRKKIEAAREMLLCTQLSITQIACALAFSSSQHFANIFRQYEGQTPTEYRKSPRTGGQPVEP